MPLNWNRFLVHSSCTLIGPIIFEKLKCKYSVIDWETWIPQSSIWVILYLFKTLRFIVLAEFTPQLCIYDITVSEKEVGIPTVMIGRFNNSLFLFKQRCIFSKVRYHWHRIKIKQIHFFFQFWIFNSCLLWNCFSFRYGFESRFIEWFVSIDCFVQTSDLWIGFCFIQASKRDAQAWCQKGDV